MMTAEELIDFELSVAEDFNNGRIPYPIHLSGGNELALIDVFRNVNRGDWVCSTWRSHYHALLHGVPAHEVKAAIMAGHSITLTFPEHRFISSAIVGGMAPIAVGLGLAIQRDGGDEKVWCFIGDMGARTGIVHESIQFARGHNLPVRWIVEDNGISVCTDTNDAWGVESLWAESPVDSYHYHLGWPHAGSGKRIEF